MNTPESLIEKLAALEADYSKVRYRLIRCGNHSPETKADIAYLVAHNPSAGVSFIDELAMLVESYRSIAHEQENRTPDREGPAPAGKLPHENALGNETSIAYEATDRTAARGSSLIEKLRSGERKQEDLNDIEFSQTARQQVAPSEIRDNTADVMYDQLLWQLIRYANICPDDKGKYSVSAAFSYIHKNSWRYAAERFIHDALHLIELYRAKASESKPVTWTNDDRAVMEKENALLKERLMKCNEVIMRHTARDLQNPLEPVSVSLEKCAKLYCDSYYEYSILDRGGYSRQEFIDKFWDRWKPLVKHFLDAAGVKYVD